MDIGRRGADHRLFRLAGLFAQRPICEEATILYRRRILFCRQRSVQPHSLQYALRAKPELRHDRHPRTTVHAGQQQLQFAQLLMEHLRLQQHQPAGKH